MSLHQMRTYELDDSLRFEHVYFVLVQRLEAISSLPNVKFSILIYAYPKTLSYTTSFQ